MLSLHYGSYISIGRKFLSADTVGSHDPTTILEKSDLSSITTKAKSLLYPIYRKTIIVY